MGRLSRELVGNKLFDRVRALNSQVAPAGQPGAQHCAQAPRSDVPRFPEL